MREVKTFFSQGNGLNKGYAAEVDPSNNEDENSIANIARRKMAQNLPSADLMTSYEEMYPGTFEKLLKAVEKEQAHRHNAELVNIQMYSRASAMGRLFGFFVICAIGYTTFQLAINDMLTGALIFAGLAFAGIFGVSFMAYCRTSGRSYNDRRRNSDRNQSSAPARAQVAPDKRDAEKKESGDVFKPRYGNGQRRRRR